MYLFYNDTQCFGVDGYAAFFLVELIKKDLENGKVYKKSDMATMPNTKNRHFKFSLTTHKHFDHSGGNECLQSEFGIRVYGTDYFLEHKNEQLIFDNKPIIPIHTTDSFCFNINNQFCLTGDFIFKLGCGHFFEGTGEDFVKSFRKLDDNTDKDILFLYGHDYFENNMKFAKIKRKYSEEELFLCNKNIFLTKQQEKMLNPFLSTDDPAEVQKLRNEKTKM